MNCLIQGISRGLLTAAVLSGAGLPKTMAGFTHLPGSVTGLNHVRPASGPTSFLHMSGGGAAGDYDGDGWVDLYFTRFDGPDHLYRNLGNGTFEDVALPAGLAQPYATNGAAFGDIDNDGDLDLYVSGIGPNPDASPNRHYLFINQGDGTFTEEAIARSAHVSLTSSPTGMSVAMGDYDRDGYLDLLTSDWDVPTTLSSSKLLRNEGADNPGHFIDVTSAAGLDVFRKNKSYRFAPRFSDLDNDGNPDIAIVSDFETSQLFWNNGNGTFTDGTIPAGVGIDTSGMGSTIGDYDNDGDLDWYVTSILFSPTSDPNTNAGNKLYRNEGNRQFTEVAFQLDVMPVGWWWGTSWLDYDNDGHLDLIATNGWFSQFPDDPTTLWHNNGDGTFTNVTLAEGITDTGQGRGLMTLDYDNDGDLDVVVINNDGEPVFYRNDAGNGNAYLKIKTIGTASNRDGIGARIIMDPDTTVIGDEQYREIDGGSNFLSQNEMTAHFGLGPFSGTIDNITIHWPSGITQQFFDINPNQLFEVVEAYLAGDLDGDGRVGMDDLNIVLANWNASVVTGLHRSGDPSGDGFVGIADLNRVLSNWNAGGTPPSASSSVPEPHTVAPLLMLMLGLGRHRPHTPHPHLTR